MGLNLKKMIGFNFMFLIPFTSGNMDAVLGYVGDLVSDFMPLIVVFFGIAIGFWVIDKILHRKGD